MAILALVVLVAWIALVTGLRGYLHYRRTGQIPNLGRDEPGSPQRWSKLISVLGVALAVAAPVADLLGVDPIPFLNRPAVRWTGLGLAIAGIAGTLAAQSAMGDSWRGDVDPHARTPLVTTGPFSLVRNPILAYTLVTAVGLALMVPNVFAVLMLTAFVAALEIQVRLVEEPYLERVHEDAYRRYAAQAGQFLPGIGRLPYITRDPSG